MADESVEEFGAEWAERMGALNERMGIKLVEWSPQKVVGTMPVEGNTQPYGLLHGGASVVLAESLGSTGSALHGYPDRIAVGVDINATHHRAARSGTVTGVATPVTVPAVAERWWVALMSTPTAIRSGYACSAAAVEPSDSASTHDAPPCRSP